MCGCLDEAILIKTYSIPSHRENKKVPGRVAQSVGHLTRKSEVLGSIPGPAIYFCLFFR